MNRLFTYTIPVDDGAAPNPFRGVCTLAICKPGIRRSAEKGDWVAGLGSRNAPSGDLGGRLVYAMRVDEVVTMKEYDESAPHRWPHRVPNINSLDLSERLGDCIYNFIGIQPVLRPSVHGPQNIATDLDGKNVLISEHYYYFGSRAIGVPEHLSPIIHQTQGYKSNANNDYVHDFIQWLQGSNFKTGQIYGWPDYIVDWENRSSCGGCIERKKDGESDCEH